MNDNGRNFSLYKKSPLYQFFASILIVIVTGGVLTIMLTVAGILIFGGDFTDLAKPATTFSTNEIVLLRYVLIVQDISCLFIPSIIILVLMQSESSKSLPELKIPPIKGIGLVVILTFCIFSITSFTGQINSEMHLPGWLSGLEHWMTDKEEKADKVIELLVVSNTFWVMLLNLLTIAIIPSIAEELFFRGVFQKIFVNLFKSGHLGIWFTAFIFSTIHFQFFGFVPRFILGLVFGYLFFWSGTLWLPVISHFVNNAVPVILAYLQGMEKFNAPPAASLLKQALFLPLPIVISLVILFYFRKKRKFGDITEINLEQVI
jgi:uncharacterized protein